MGRSRLSRSSWNRKTVLMAERRGERLRVVRLDFAEAERPRREEQRNGAPPVARQQHSPSPLIFNPNARPRPKQYGGENRTERCNTRAFGEMLKDALLDAADATWLAKPRGAMDDDVREYFPNASLINMVATSDDLLSMSHEELERQANLILYGEEDEIAPPHSTRLWRGRVYIPKYRDRVLGYVDPKKSNAEACAGCGRARSFGSARLCRSCYSGAARTKYEDAMTRAADAVRMASFWKSREHAGTEFISARSGHEVVRLPVRVAVTMPATEWWNEMTEV